MGGEGSGRQAGLKNARRNFTTEELIRNSLKNMGIEVPDDSCPITDLVMQLIMDPKTDHTLRVNASLKLMEFVRPRLKQVEHVGNINAVQVQLTHAEIKKILAADPFQSAIEVAPEPATKDPLK